MSGYGLVTVGAFGVVPLRKERSRLSFYCFVRVIPILYTVLDGTLSSFGQCTTSGLPIYLPEKAVSEKRFLAV